MKEETKNIIIIGLVLVVIAIIFIIGGSTGKKEEKKMNQKENLKGTHNIEIVIKDYGTIKAELYADIAPITVTNFLKLVNENFYDGLTFHRVVSGFMIQGGDPSHNGTGGSSETIKGEFSSNGVENSLSHTRGTLSMARSNNPNSASSQFFIMHKDYQGLDGNYAAFGRVTEGIEIVDEICKNTPVEEDGESVSFENQPVIEKIIEVK